MDCPGVFSEPFNCGKDGKCGGNGAACRARDRTAEGESYACVSGLFYHDSDPELRGLLVLCDVEYCSAGFCSGGLHPSPTPNAEKRQILQPGQVRQQLCPAGMTACPVQPKGYEVRSHMRLCEAT
jgi:hypothetical protein